ncbi:AMP-binding protein [Streptomyces sp. NPDC088732]|uniref:AMP-binding protein n=1 Tax=Streptomyces sp. NPDC088732 TaxID=3365879 RepID=UPI003826DF37
MPSSTHNLQGDGAHGAAASGPSLVHGLLDAAAHEAPEAPAVSDGADHWTYRRLARLSHAFAQWLLAQGVRPGDRVAVRLPTTARLAVLLFGTSRAGAVFVPLNPETREFQLRPLLADAEPALLVAEAAAASGLGGLTPAPVHSIEDVWADVERRADLPDGERLPGAAVAPTALAVLLYTSGSTSTPKAVACPHAQVVFAASAIQQVLGYRPDDVVLSRFPMSWDVGLYKVLLSTLGRSHLVLVGDGTSDLVLMRRIRETAATVVPVVPSLAAMLVKLAAREAEPVPGVRMFTSTGAALPQATIDGLRRAFPGARVVRQYGQTECKRLTVMPVDRDDERPGSVGLALPGTSVLIVDGEGRPVPAGETGEIVAAGPHVMPGYWRDPERSAVTFRPDGAGGLRLHTGDFGRLDEDGFLYFEGRRDDLFKRRGTRMSVVEIEAAAADIPGVRACVVLAPTDRRDLAIVVASELDPHTVLRELARRLEPAKVPAHCRTLAELPLTPHGKSDRKALAAMIDGETR